MLVDSMQQETGTNILLVKGHLAYKENALEMMSRSHMPVPKPKFVQDLCTVPGL